jgi:hypothetical protein
MGETKETRVTWAFEGSGSKGWLDASFAHPRQSFSTGAIWEMSLVSSPTEGAQFTSKQLLEKLERAANHYDDVMEVLRFYAEGAPCCADDSGAPVEQGCKHGRCEFPECAKKQFPKWDGGRVARAAIRKARGK